MDEFYHVTELTKRVWAIQLDLFEIFKKICVKYDLKYCATAGTLLGAVRHKGFIPWDDDMDLGLMWNDYQILLEVAPKECQYPYFFQSYLTERDGEASACRLRRSDTTAITKWEYENVGDEYDRGIFIDIFPLFYVPDDLQIRETQRKKVLYYWQCIRGHDALRQKIQGKKINEDYQRFIPVYEEISGEMSIEAIKTEYLNACAIANSPQKEIGATSSRVHEPKLMWNTKWFESYVELPFENTTISCPMEYEKVLEKQYGDWRTPVMGGAVHEMVALDTETPWREFDMSRIR